METEADKNAEIGPVVNGIEGACVDTVIGVGALEAGDATEADPEPVDKAERERKRLKEYERKRPNRLTGCGAGKRGPNYKRVTDDQLAQMLEASGGFMSVVAQKIGVTVWAVSQRVKRSQKLQQTVWGLKNTVVDIAESQLVAAVKRGEAWAVKYVLACQGKERGWMEKSQLENGGEPDRPPIIFAPIPVARVEAEKKAHEERAGEVVDVTPIEES